MGLLHHLLIGLLACGATAAAADGQDEPKSKCTLPPPLVCAGALSASTLSVDHAAGTMEAHAASGGAR